MASLLRLEEVFRSVLEKEANLLSPFQIEIAHGFFEAEDTIKRIVFKLINYRKKEYNRLVTLVDDANIEEFERVRGILKLSILCSCSGPLDDDHLGWLDLLKLSELRELATSIRASSSNSDLCTLKKKIAEYYLGQKTLDSFFNASGPNSGKKRLVEVCKKITGTLVSLSNDVRNGIYEMFVIYYKSRIWPDNGMFMKDTILSNMENNSVHFYEYKIWSKDTIWKNRETFLAYYQGLKNEYAARLMYAEGTSEGYTQCLLIADKYRNVFGESLYSDMECDVTYEWLAPYTHVYVILRILDLSSKALFKLKRYSEQAEILSKLLSQKKYHKSKRGEWYTELAKIYHLYIDQEKAVHTCIQALNDGLTETDSLIFIKKRLEKLRKIQIFQQKKIDVPSVVIKRNRVHSKRYEKALWMNKSGKAGTVEEVALEYFTARHGWKGIHSETSIITTLFGLLFWDIIFDDTIPGVFWSGTQDSPLDLRTHFFYEGRRDSISLRLKEIADGKSPEIITDIFNKESGKKTICTGVHWHRYSLEILLEVCKCIGSVPLSDMCEAMCKKYRLFQSGAPDLCVWNFDKEKILFVEVKGDNDIISERQHIWIEKLLSINIGAAIAYVKRDTKSKGKMRIKSACNREARKC